MAIKVNFFCTYTFFFVPLHREPALGMSAHQRRRVADIIIRRLLFILATGSFRNLRLKNRRKEVPRFFYIYTNEAFGADVPQN